MIMMALTSLVALNKPTCAAVDSLMIPSYPIFSQDPSKVTTTKLSGPTLLCFGHAHPGMPAGVFSIFRTVLLL